MNKHSLHISKIINGGFGLGQLADGRYAMMHHVLPGEEVTMVTTEDRKSYLFGKVISIDTPSRYRVQPPCPYYKDCGGCDLQHSAYEEQLRVKHGILVDLLTRQNNLHEKEIGSSILAPRPSPCTIGYRQRVRLWIKDKRFPGFRQNRSHDIVVIKRCLIAREELNEALASLTVHPHTLQLTANTEELELLYNPITSQVTAIFHVTRKPRPADFNSAAKLVDDITILERIFFTGRQIPLTAGAPAGCSNLLGMNCSQPISGLEQYTMQWEVGGFCQVNLEQNSNLVTVASDCAAVTRDETVLDLFCGSGNFSLPLAAKSHSLVGIEGQGSAIRSARANSARAGCTNTTFHKRPIHTACEEMVARKESFDCLVIDPPRQGVPGLAPLLHRLCRSRLVYISCDPATLSRDLGDLVDSGFHITRIQPVDMFPQTHHIETVVLLEKR